MEEIIGKHIYGNIYRYDKPLPEPIGGAVNFIFAGNIFNENDLLMVEPGVKKWLGRKPIHFYYYFTSGCTKIPIIGKIVVRHIKYKKTIRQAHGYLAVIPNFTEQFLLPKYKDEILARIYQLPNIAEKLNAKYIGLGASTSIITGNGKLLADKLTAEKKDIYVTSGSTYTGIFAKKGVLRACKLMGVRPRKSTISVIGATGAVGRILSLLTANHFEKIIIVARNQKRMENLYEVISAKTEGKIKIELCLDINEAISKSQVVITATNAKDSETLKINPYAFNPNSVICSVSLPNDIPEDIYEKRNDILVFNGAVVKFQGELNCQEILKMGGKDEAFGCLKETMDMALEGEKEHHSVGALINHTELNKLLSVSKKYYSPLAAWRFQGKKITAEDIKIIKKNARKALKKYFTIPQIQTT